MYSAKVFRTIEQAILGEGKTIIKIDEDTAVKISMKCLNPKCKERFRDKVYNFSYEKRKYGQKVKIPIGSVENITIQENQIKTQIVCDKCGQSYHVDIFKE